MGRNRQAEIEQELLMGIAALNPSYGRRSGTYHASPHHVGWVERSDTHRYHAA
jgi:hypothetical protein